MSKSEQPGFSGKNSGNRMNSAPYGPAGARGSAPAGSMTVADVWYALFRHKWKVIFFWLVGIGAAAGLYLKNKPPYVSEAKLLVRYVVDSRSVEALGPDGEPAAPARSGGNVVSAEGEILRSYDLCRQVAEAIGPERILGSTPGASNRVAAAAATLFGGLSVEIPKLSNVIRVSLAHSDPEVAQLCLQKLIDLYQTRHLEIHRGLGKVDTFLQTQTDQVRSRLLDLDRQLQELRTKSGIVSPEATRQSITAQIGSIRQQIQTTEAELAEYRLLSGGRFGSGTNAPISTNAVENLNSVPAGAAEVSGLPKVAPGKPPETIPPAVQVDQAASGAQSVEASGAKATPVLGEDERNALIARLESLRQQEKDLRELRTKAGPAGAGEGKHSYTDQIGRVREMILAAEASLNSTASLGRPPGLTTNKPVVGAAPLAGAKPATAGTDSLPTNSTPISAAPAVTSNPNPSDAVMEYKALLGRLEALHRQEMELRQIYTDENRTLIRVRQQLAEALAARKTMELENPSLASYQAPPPNRPGGASPISGTVPGPALPSAIDPNRVRALEVRLRILQAQLEKQKQDAVELEQFETQLNQLLRKRELDEKNYRHFAAGLDQTRFDEALGAGKLSNIGIVQSPSPARLSEGKRMKLAGIALGAGIVGGIALAFLIELMLDHSVRRSTQLETSMALPLLSTIPRMRLGGGRKRRRQLGNGDPHGGPGANGNGGPDIPGWSEGHPLRPHIEALRDRTLMHFEGDLRKPKLIGVTGCREGSGVTTIACGLAAALSEAAEGRVLLINLDSRSQSMHPFLLGRAACSVVDVVEAGKRETALIGNNLYVASNSGGDASGTAVLQPTHISRLLPKIKMSDYDYVVFDMPTVSPTSISGKLSGMVDLVFMVAESEKDTQKGLKRACQILAESNANYRVVLNKFKRYVPQWIDQEV